MKNLLITFIMLTAIKTLAAPAVGYSCVGKDSFSKKSVAMTVEYSDYVNDADFSGYTNQSITITAINGWEVDPISYQLVSDAQIEGKKNEGGEIQLKQSRVQMDVLQNTGVVDYKITIKSPKVGFDEEKSMNIKAYCVGL